jgi:hypothetical protein
VVNPVGTAHGREGSANLQANRSSVGAAIAILCERQGYKGRAAGRMISRLLVGDESRAESIRALLSAARKSHGDNPLTLHLADAWLEDLKGRHVQHWLRERLPAWQAQPQKIF